MILTCAEQQPFLAWRKPSCNSLQEVDAMVRACQITPLTDSQCLSNFSECRSERSQLLGSKPAKISAHPSSFLRCRALRKLLAEREELGSWLCSQLLSLGLVHDFAHRLLLLHQLTRSSSQLGFGIASGA